MCATAQTRSLWPNTFLPGIHQQGLMLAPLLPARLRTTAGHSLWTECLMGAAVSAVEDGNPWLAADLRDAAGQKRVEAELIRARESAYRARDEADRANLAKSRFL